MSSLSVQMFGKFCVRRNEKIVNAIDACKLQELLCYLLVYRDSPHAREGLAALLWGDSSTTQSKKYLRQALWQLQSALDSHGDKSQNRIFKVEPDWVAINPAAEIFLDVAMFEQTFALARDVSGQLIDDSLAEALKDAVQPCA